AGGRGGAMLKNGPARVAVRAGESSLRPRVTPAAAALVIVLISVGGADAHQLDEYLQAARIGIEPNRIGVEMSLTPGAGGAQQILSMLDRDGDGRLSPSETAAYARGVLRDLILELDGRSYPLELLRAGSPSWSDMRDGIGTIRLEASATVAVNHGRH